MKSKGQKGQGHALQRAHACRRTGLFRVFLVRLSFSRRAKILNVARRTDCDKYRRLRRSRSCIDRRKIRPCSGRLQQLDSGRPPHPSSCPHCTRPRLQKHAISRPYVALNRYFIDARRPIPHPRRSRSIQSSQLGRRAFTLKNNSDVFCYDIVP